MQRVSMLVSDLEQIGLPCPATQRVDAMAGNGSDSAPQRHSSHEMPPSSPGPSAGAVVAMLMRTAGTEKRSSLDGTAAKRGSGTNHVSPLAFARGQEPLHAPAMTQCSGHGAGGQQPRPWSQCRIAAGIRARHVECNVAHGLIGAASTEVSAPHGLSTAMRSSSKERDVDLRREVFNSGARAVAMVCA